MSSRVVDGQLQVISCWEDDRLVEVGLETVGGQQWSAVSREGQGLVLSEPVDMEAVIGSGLYELSGDLPAQLVAGDRVEIRTEQESVNAVLDDALLSNQDPLDC